MHAFLQVQEERPAETELKDSIERKDIGDESVDIPNCANSRKELNILWPVKEDLSHAPATGAGRQRASAGVEARRCAKQAEA